MTAAVTPGGEEMLSLIRSAFNEGFNEGGREHTTHGGGKTWAESRALKKFTELSDRLAAKPADEEYRSIIEGVKNVLEFAIGLAWDAERLIPDSEPKRLRDMLNNIRQGYLKPAVKRLKAAPSTTGEPKQ